MSDNNITIESNQSEGHRLKKKKKDINSYRNIIKGSSFFGGVQIFNILVTLIRGKFVAIILGPEGMGITALFNSASNSIQRLTSLGVNQSIIREIALEKEDPLKLETTVRTSIGLTNLTACLGFILCSALCIPLSKLTFGDASYWWQFIVLGVAIAFGILSAGKLSILQGLHEVKRISRASIVGGLTGLGIGIPLYYIFSYKGIVFSILAVSLALYLFYSYSFKKSFTYSATTQKRKDYFAIAKNLLLLGIVLMSGDMITTLVTYLINLYIRMEGNVDDVGLYQAANSVTYQFAGMIFSALAMDYFPRLSSVAKDNVKMNSIVNRQSDVVSWLMTPAMTLLILSSPLIIKVLLAESFSSIIPLMRWMGLGMLIRAFSFPMAYITFAKGNKKVFFILEGLIANGVTLAFSCLFFKWFGLIGLGYALVADNAFCFILYFIVNNRLYGYSLTKEASINYIIGGILTAGCFIFAFLESETLSYSLMGIFSAIALTWGFLALKSHFKNSV